MTRLHTIAPADAIGPAAALFGAIRNSIGMVPNAYATAGSNSPVALKAALALDAALRETSLTTQHGEIIKLAVSASVGCDYCVAAHTLMGKKAGLSRDAIFAIRHGAAGGDAAINALAHFARLLVSTTGTVPIEEVNAIKAAGYSDAQIVDTMLAIASITFTNLLNRVNDTTLDFPVAD